MKTRIKNSLVAPKVISLTNADEATQEDFEIAIAALRRAGDLPKSVTGFAYLKGDGEIVPLPPGAEVEAIKTTDNKQRWSVPTAQLYLLTKD